MTKVVEEMTKVVETQTHSPVVEIQVVEMLEVTQEVEMPTHLLVVETMLVVEPQLVGMLIHLLVITGATGI